MIPFFIDLPYLEPMVDVFRLDEFRFKSYPQEPQLQEQNSNVTGIRWPHCECLRSDQTIRRKCQLLAKDLKH